MQGIGLENQVHSTLLIQKLEINEPLSTGLHKNGRLKFSCRTNLFCLKSYITTHGFTYFTST